ncbi:MAG: protein kinase, partial [Actinomycetota bacterium]|nr:protein kinase [Actinomycetota bacterium]
MLGKRYSLRDRLDRGTGEEIWRAHDDVLGREVAVALGAREDFATGVDELISAARLSDECVERILDAGTDEDGRLYVVTEFVPGETLRELMDREGPLPPERAAGVMAPVLTALQYGHRLGIAHGRVGPERVLLGHDGRVRLAGFGLGDASSASAEEDVRAAGRTLFEALTGQPPPPGDPAPSARSFRGGIPRELDETLRGVLGGGEGRRRREPTADEFRSSLERFAGTPVEETGSEEPRPRQSSSFFRSWMLLPLLLAAAAGVAIVVGLALGRLEVGGPL